MSTRPLCKSWKQFTLCNVPDTDHCTCFSARSIFLAHPIGHWRNHRHLTKHNGLWSAHHCIKWFGQGQQKWEMVNTKESQFKPLYCPWPCKSYVLKKRVLPTLPWTLHKVMCTVQGLRLRSTYTWHHGKKWKPHNPIQISKEKSSSLKHKRIAYFTSPPQKQACIQIPLHISQTIFRWKWGRLQCTKVFKMEVGKTWLHNFFYNGSGEDLTAQLFF